MANHDLHRNIAMVGLSPSPHVLQGILTASKASKVPPGHQPPRQHQESDLAVVSRWANSDDSDAPMMTVMTHEAERIPTLICFDDL